RRHTRSKRDWSSDVCSSDLDVLIVVPFRPLLSAPAVEYPVHRAQAARLVDDEARPDVAHPGIVEFGVDHGDRVAEPLAEVALGMLGLSAGDDDRHRSEFAGGAR